jgi:hypothetical protein
MPDSRHIHEYHEVMDWPMTCPVKWCEWNDPHFHAEKAAADA